MCSRKSLPSSHWSLVPSQVILWNIFIQYTYYISPCSLADLNLSHNQLSKLPDEFANLSALNNLNISHNSFIVLPQVVFKLPKLSTLDAQHNAILGELCIRRFCLVQKQYSYSIFHAFQRSTLTMPSAATAWLWWIYAIIPSADIVVENWKILKLASGWRSQIRSMTIGREFVGIVHETNSSLSRESNVLNLYLIYYI